ncbi:MAG: hypothetical protein AAF311_03420 [Pseudomonadota bacterium]
MRLKLLAASLFFVACQADSNYGNSELFSDTGSSSLPEGYVVVEDSMSNAHEFMNLFNEFCAANMPRLDKIESAARLYSWENLPAEMANMVSPADPSTPFKGWYIPSENLPVMIGITETVFEGEPAYGCSLAADLDGNQVKGIAVKSFPDAKLIADQTQHGQRYRIWQGTDYIYNLTDASPSELTGVSLSMMWIGEI